MRLEPLLILALLPLAPQGARKETRMQLHTTAFSEGKPIPLRFTSDGPDLSPALEWSGAPSDTRAYALIMDDPDAPSGTWVHWVIYDLPASLASLPEGLPRSGDLPRGGRQGKNSWPRLGYNGPAPPPGKAHRYIFHLYALSAPLGLPAGATRSEVERAMKGKVLAEADVMGTYRH
jgi:hypothetical protein